jgi:hypothetical protein
MVFSSCKRRQIRRNGEETLKGINEMIIERNFASSEVDYTGNRLHSNHASGPLVR